MPDRDTSVAIQQAIYPGSKCHTGRDTSVAIQQAITYRSQIKGDDLQPVYPNRKRLFSC